MAANPEDKGMLIILQLRKLIAEGTDFKTVTYDLRDLYPDNFQGFPYAFIVDEGEKAREGDEAGSRFFVDMDINIEVGTLDLDDPFWAHKKGLQIVSNAIARDKELNNQTVLAYPMAVERVETQWEAGIFVSNITYRIEYFYDLGSK